MYLLYCSCCPSMMSHLISCCVPWALVFAFIAASHGKVWMFNTLSVNHRLLFHRPTGADTMLTPRQHRMATRYDNLRCHWHENLLVHAHTLTHCTLTMLAKVLHNYLHYSDVIMSVMVSQILNLSKCLFAIRFHLSLYFGRLNACIINFKLMSGDFTFVNHDDVIKWKHFSCYCPLYGEFTGDRWIPLTKASDAELWCFLWFGPE